jgi:hypothetical protein
VVQLLLGVTQALQVSLAHRATASSRSFRHAHDEPQVVDAQGRARERACAFRARARARDSSRDGRLNDRAGGGIHASG